MTFHTDHFYLSQQEPNKGCLLALRKIILNQDKNISETIKWSIPCFSFKKKIFCFLNVDKKVDEPYILFAEGKYLNHPNLEIGKRLRMKIFRINPNEDIPINTIKAVLTDALDLYNSV